LLAERIDFTQLIQVTREGIFLMHEIKFIFLIFLFLTSCAHVDTVTVGGPRQCGGGDCNYTDIQTAIDRASAAGRTIRIWPEAVDDTVYSTALTDGGKDNITLIGMVADQGICIDGTGQPEESDASFNLSGQTGWHVENIWFRDDDNYTENPKVHKNVRINGGGSHAFRKCRFASFGRKSNVREFYEVLVQGDTTNLTMTENIWNGNCTGTNYFGMDFSGTSGLIYKYNRVLMSNIYVGLKLYGSTGHIVSYNYFNPVGFAENVSSFIYFRDSGDSEAKYNLMVLTAAGGFDSSMAQNGAIRIRESKAKQLDIQHNTVILPGSVRKHSIGIFFDQNAGIDPGGDNIVKNNLISGGRYSVASDLIKTNPSTVAYNYFHAPDKTYRSLEAARKLTIFFNNTETSISPGFIGVGIDWQTDGTDAGTTSKKYSLRPDAPAKDKGEAGTYCGAFGVSGAL
jgi:hypothetical protein